MKKITFVTTNKGKIASAKQYLGDLDIEVEPYNYELIEPRTDDIQEIAKQKVLQAYELVKHPCIAMDSGFYIDALNGFPRAFVNFALDTLGVNGILDAMRGKENRKCSFKECVAYYDGKDLKYFFYEHKGILANEYKGVDKNDQWSPLWHIYKDSFDLTKTLSELTDEEMIQRRKLTGSSLQEFAKWYKDVNKEDN